MTMFQMGFTKVDLNPPYDTKLLTQMPEPRCYHGLAIMDNQVMVAGGMASDIHQGH